MAASFLGEDEFVVEVDLERALESMKDIKIALRRRSSTSRLKIMGRRFAGLTFLSLRSNFPEVL